VNVIGAHPYMRCHLIRGNLSNISTQYPVVQPVEKEEQSNVHPRVRLCIKDDVQPKESCHHYNVTNNTQSIAQLVDEVEPLVYQSEKGKRNSRFFVEPLQDG
jgi:hypothetical protein